MADFFWLLGYIPMGIGLVTRVLTMPTKPNRSQNMIIWGASAATILIAVAFIFRPFCRALIQTGDREHPQYHLSACRPFPTDHRMRLFFTYEGGDYGFAWRLLVVGFIFMTVSDFYLYI